MQRVLCVSICLILNKPVDVTERLQYCPRPGDATDESHQHKKIKSCTCLTVTLINILSYLGPQMYIHIPDIIVLVSKPQ